MVKKILKKRLVYFYMSLASEEVLILDNYVKALNDKYQVKSFTRSTALAILLNKVVLPQLEKTPPVKPVATVEVASVDNKPPVLSGGVEVGNS